MVCLTFDDGLPCHYKKVVPELTRRGMWGTFFVPILPINGGNDEVFDVRFRDDEWKKAISEGHEIGGHSVRHRKLKETPSGEVPMCQNLLREILGVEPRSYAWPFCETNTYHIQVAEKHFDQARGGPLEKVPGTRPGLCLDKTYRHNWPSFAVGDWNIEELIANPAPGVYMFHGVDQPGSWGNVSWDQFTRFLDAVKTSVTFAEYTKEKL
jgi:peptidoglycan/xylan/chitin deacetylase (PgdA/CDA1 family)